MMSSNEIHTKPFDLVPLMCAIKLCPRILEYKSLDTVFLKSCFFDSYCRPPSGCSLFPRATPGDCYFDTASSSRREIYRNGHQNINLESVGREDEKANVTLCAAAFSSDVRSRAFERDAHVPSNGILSASRFPLNRICSVAQFLRVACYCVSRIFCSSRLSAS